MFFQISPVHRVKSRPSNKSHLQEDETPTLVLAPFTTIPKLEFACKVDEQEKLKLNIKNPKLTKLDANVYFDGPDELHVFFNWQERILDGNSSDVLEILWKPREEYAARHSIKILADKKTWNVPVGFNSTSPTKSKSGLKKKKPVSVTLVKKPPIPKTSIIKKSSSKTIQSKNDQLNKENIDSNNVAKDLFLSPTNVTFNLKESVNDRRCTYIVQTPRIPSIKETTFENSPINLKPSKLELQQQVQNVQMTPFIPRRRSVEEQEKKSNLQFPVIEVTLSENNESNLLKSPNIEELLMQQNTPYSQQFQPGRCSTEMQPKSGIVFQNSSNHVKSLTFEDQNLANLSSSTRILDNLSFEKVFSSSKYVNNNKKNSSSENLLEMELSAINEDFVFEKPAKIKRKSDTTLNFSPPKKQIICSETWTKSSAYRSSNFRRINEGFAYRIESKNVTIIKDPFILATTSTYDPFLSNLSIHLDENWMEMQEIKFKRWFNKLLAPPKELNVHDDTQKIDIAKIWKQSAVQTDASPNMTKEQVCNKNYTTSKLDILRKNARKLFENADIQAVLAKISNAIEVQKLEIRQDKNIHLDLNLQSNVMSLFLSYNSLWLRIGIETVYKEKLQLNSNSDVVNLIRFLHERFFKDPRLMKKHKTVHNPKYTSDIKKFMLRKFLEIVYFLDKAKTSRLIPHDPCLFRKNSEVKESREILILFARDAITAGVGDVNKYLKLFGYIVEHKQLYIHEFDFSVSNLGGDLRDGVRLVRTLEIILLKGNLLSQLRVPAISRLQKVHNVKLAFEHLKEAGFEIHPEIEPHHIVDGHREKTLSFLWQIIHKFHAPYIVQNVKLLQGWWRSLPVVIKRRKFAKKHQAANKIQQWFRRKLFMKKIEIFHKCLEYFLEQKRREKAAIKIQNDYRAYVQRKNYLKLKNAVVKLQRNFRARIWDKKIEAVITLQKFTRMFIERKKYLKLKASVVTIENVYISYKIRKEFLTIKASVSMIQEWYKSTVLMRKSRAAFLKLKSTVLYVEQKYKARKLKEICLENYVNLKNSTIFVQRKFRANKSMKIERGIYMKKRRSCIVIQRFIRGFLEMKKLRKSFQLTKNAAIKIQLRFRANKLMEKERTNFLQLKNATIKIQATVRMYRASKHFENLKKAANILQSRYRAKKWMEKSRSYYIALRNAAILIQRKFVARNLMRVARTEFLANKNAATKIQSFVRMCRARKQYANLKNAARIIQSRYRAKKLMKMKKAEYTALKNSAILIQRKFVARNLMKVSRSEFLAKKNAAIKIQSLFRMYRGRKQFEKLKNVCIVLQSRYRAKKLMEKNRSEFLFMRNSAILIQRKFVAWNLMKVAKSEFLAKKNAAIKIQAFVRMCYAKKQFEKLKKATEIIQNRFRAKKLMEMKKTEYTALRNSAIMIQRKFVARNLMKVARSEFLAKKNAAIKTQSFFRMYRERKRFEKLKDASRILQTRYRAKKLMEKNRSEYISMRNAAVFIQRKFVARNLMKIARNNFLALKNAAIKIQSLFRMYCEEKQFKKLKNAAVVLQSRYRAKKLMEKNRSDYLTLRNSAILIQRKFVAMNMMRVARREYSEKKEAAIKIQAFVRMCHVRIQYETLKKSVQITQSRYRAKKLMEKNRCDYIALRNATISIQRKFVARNLMIVARSEFLTLRNAVLKIQSLFRMRKVRNEFLNLKSAVEFVQTRFRSNKLILDCRQDYFNIRRTPNLEMIKTIINNAPTLERKEFLILKSTVLRLEIKYSAKKSMEKCRTTFLQQKHAAIKIQKYFKGYLLMLKQRNEFLQLRKTVTWLQTKYKSKKCMEKSRNDFTDLKRSALLIQRRFRSNKLMEAERTRFLRIKTAAVKIQRFYRRFILMKRERSDFLKVTSSVSSIQRFARGYLARKKYGHLLSLEAREARKEKRKRESAATKIQSLWRGFNQRKNCSEKIKEIRENLVIAQNEADPQNTLRNRMTNALQTFTTCNLATKSVAVAMLKDFDYLTRRSKEICEQVGPVIPNYLYVIMKSIPRSLPDMEIHTYALLTLINLYRYPVTSTLVWFPDNLDGLLSIMLHWCDKEAEVFSCLATLFWLFAQNEEYKIVIKHLPTLSQKLDKIQDLVLRKQKMVIRSGNKVFISRFYPYSNKLPMPGIIADWGIDYAHRPRIFTNSVHAMECLVDILRN